MRIIAGKYGGRVIMTPTGRQMHPMGERIRNAIFNKLGALVNDAYVLDAFAGTGAIGIEVLSRGASSCVFIEKKRATARILQQNLEMLGINGQSGHVVQATVLQYLDTTENNQQFDLIFADPPYFDPQNSAVQALAKRLKAGGLLILSNPKSAVDLEIDDLIRIDQRQYAEAKISFYRKNQ
ncbi:MAG: 16S rRNA (guanine(966)-N(2))-methyltransferase RsmD [Candidatus Saccharibacteria bacterium]|nr:16S rRNA (guanine(966)-N(2))-methyltransferase RsmD [Candidatus Saccharibacteria bacterium]